MSPRILLGALPAIFLVLSAVPTHAAKRTLIDRAGIIVNNKIVTMQEVNSSLALKESDLRRRYKGQELTDKLGGLERNVVDGIIESLLLEARAEQLGIQVTEKEIEDRVNLIIKRDPRITSVYSDSALKEFVVKDILRKRVVRREVSSKVFVGEDAIQAACRAESSDSREVDVGHILIRGDSPESKARILAIRDQLEGGADFTQMAVQHSQDPQAKENKGRLGFISRGQFFKEFEDAAYSLRPNELSLPVKTKFGYHLIRSYGERSKSKVNCSEIEQSRRQRLRDRIWNERRVKQMEKFLAELRKDSEIIVFDRDGTRKR